MTFTADESAACRRLVDWALREDLGDRGDLTGEAVIPADLAGKAVLTARADGVLAGLPAAELVFAILDANVTFQTLVEDGSQLTAGDPLARVTGPMRSILAAERTALNFLQHLSGIATQTRRYVDAVNGLACRILDTRKTTPGWRLLEKYAVRCGGGTNHRLGLHDGVLIKDNHLAALGPGITSIAETIRAARAHVGSDLPVEVEVDTLDQLDAALAARPDIVLLDNMTLDHLREAVRRRTTLAPQVLLEASGGVNLATVRAIGETGVDRISVGALTHSSPALDIALDYLS